MTTPAISSTMKSFRLAHMTQAHVNAYSVLSSTGKTLATIAAALGTTVDDAEKKLGILVDEGLAARTIGDRTTAVYTAAV